jgi:hypothetical protein
VGEVDGEVAGVVEGADDCVYIILMITRVEVVDVGKAVFGAGADGVGVGVDGDIIDLAVVRLDASDQLELDVLRVQTHPVGLQIALHVADQQRLESGIEIERSDGVVVKLEAAIVLGLFQEHDVAEAAIIPADDDYFLVDGSYGEEGGKLLQIKTSLLAFL